MNWGIYAEQATVKDQAGWLTKQSVCLSLWEIRESEHRRLEPWSSETNDFKTDTCHLPSLPLGIIRIG